jgi:hypothetical protein
MYKQQGNNQDNGKAGGGRFFHGFLILWPGAIYISSIPLQGHDGKGTGLKFISHPKPY